MAALAVAIMCLGGLIPVATYVCPVLCILLLAVVLRSCGKRIAWAWYGAVTILCLLMGPDKEAAAVFAFLGHYPIVKPGLDRSRMKWIWKLLFFNCAVGILYFLLIHLFGMAQIMDDFRELGVVMLAVMLLAGNLIFFLLDRILDRFFPGNKK